jgi:hypothetical protein
MSKREVQHSSGPRSGATVERTARISWLTDPPEGHATVSVGSRAVRAAPMSLQGAEDDSRVTDAGELMAAAHGSAVAAFLAQVLVRDGTPAHELVVNVTYAFAGEWLEGPDRTLYVEGRVPDSDPSRFEEAVREAVKLCAASFGTPEHPSLTLTSRLL